MSRLYVLCTLIPHTFIFMVRPYVSEYNEYFDYLCTQFWYILGGGHQMRDTDSWDSYYYALVRGNQR